MTDPRYPIGKFAPPADYTPDLRASFVREIAAAPAALTAAVDGLTTEQRLTPYRDGGWTVAQVVHHVADSHMHAYARMKFAATEDVPTIKPYNEGIWANFAGRGRRQMSIRHSASSNRCTHDGRRFSGISRRRTSNADSCTRNAAR